MQFASTGELARRTGVSPTTAWRTCIRYPGFAVHVGGIFQIPEVHVRRVEKGEFPGAIAAEARAGSPSDGADPSQMATAHRLQKPRVPACG